MAEKQLVASPNFEISSGRFVSAANDFMIAPIVGIQFEQVDHSTFFKSIFASSPNTARCENGFVRNSLLVLYQSLRGFCFPGGHGIGDGVDVFA